MRPYLDLDVLYSHTPRYMETGPTGFALAVDRREDLIFAASPNIEVGGRLDLSEQLWLRPYASVGVTFLTDDEFVSRVRLQGSTDPSGGYDSSARLPNFLGDVSGGVQIFSSSGYELKAEYKAQFGDNYLGQEGSLRFAVRF
jgi:hypothetical protein